MIPGLPPVFMALDPGFAKNNGTGWALFVNKQLHSAGLSDSVEAAFPDRIREICAGIPVYQPQPHRTIEHMRIYPGPQQKGDQNDLLDLAFLEGALAAAASSFSLVPARSWKGNVKKDVLQERISKRFDITKGGDPIESAVFHDAVQKIRSAEKRGSVIEAVGIGLWAVGRLG